MSGVAVSFWGEAISIIQWPATIHAGCPCSLFWMLEIMPHLWFALISRIIVIMSPPMSIDMPGVAVSVVLVCASAGANVLDIPPMIAKAATTAAVRIVVFIKQVENTIDLKDLRESSLISFITHYIAGSLALGPILLLGSLI